MFSHTLAQTFVLRASALKASPATLVPSLEVLCGGNKVVYHSTTSYRLADGSRVVVRLYPSDMSFEAMI